VETRSKLVVGLAVVGTLAVVVVLLRMLNPGGDRTVDTEPLEKASTSTKIDTVTTVRPANRTFTARAEATPTTRPERTRVERIERRITGRVTDQGGSPIEGARVAANNDESTATSNSDGRYELVAPQRTWMISASREDYVTTAAYRIAPDLTTLDFVLLERKPVTLVGRVVRGPGKEPIPGFIVAGGEFDAVREPEPSNRFSVQTFSGERFTFRIEAPGFVGRTIRESIPAEASGTIEKEYELGTGAVVKGRVVRVGSRQPVADAEVSGRSWSGDDRGRGWGGRGDSGRDDAGTSVTTGPDGRFVLTFISPGDLSVFVRPPAPLADTRRGVGRVQHAQEVDVGDIEVGEGGKIVARLIRVPGDIPIPNEKVAIEASRGRGPQQLRSAETDSDGEAEFDRLAPGRYEVVSQEFGIRGSVNVEYSEEKHVTLRVGSGTLRGLILKDARPVQAQVMFYRQSMQPAAQVRSDEEGRFEVSTLAPGKWNMVIISDRRQFSELVAEVPELGVKEQTFVLPSGDIIGKVVNAANEPVAGATVVALAESELGMMVSRFSGRGGFGGRGDETEQDGSFRLRDQPPGLVGVVARKGGEGASEVVTVNVPEMGESQPVTLKLDSGTGALVSTVLDFETGQPIREAWLTIANEKGRLPLRQRRSDDGTVRLTDIPPGSYEVEVTASGFTAVRHRVQIRSGQTESLTDVLSRAGALQLSVLDKNGAGVPNAICRLEPLDRQSIQMPVDGRTDGVGYWLSRGLLPGNYSLSAQAPSGSSARVNVTIQPNQNTQESLTLP
jgi:large repetitive protein